MNWSEAVAVARSERSRRTSAKELAEHQALEARQKRGAELCEIAHHVEEILAALDDAAWHGARHYGLGFQGYIKFFRQLKGQGAIRVTITELVIARAGLENPHDTHAAIEFFRYPYDGYRAFVICGLPSSDFPVGTQSGMVSFCGDPRALRADYILRAVARWSVENEAPLPALEGAIALSKPARASP